MERRKCCLPARLYSIHTYAGRSISIPTQLIVRPCYQTYIGPAHPTETGLLFLAWNHYMFRIKTFGLVCQDAMMCCCRESMLLRSLFVAQNHNRCTVSRGCTGPQPQLFLTQPKFKARTGGGIIGHNWCIRLE